MKDYNKRYTFYDRKYGQSVDELSTDDLASMGLVKIEDVNARLEKVETELRFCRDILNDPNLCTVPTYAEPHVWEVGQYALCPDGQVRRVVEYGKREDLDYEIMLIPYGCTPVPEPPMPSSPNGWKYLGNHAYMYQGLVLSEKAWLAAVTIDKGTSLWADETIDFFTSIAEWRKLVGEGGENE
jgi:hypothetical protein